MAAHGIDVHLIASLDNQSRATFAVTEGVPSHDVPMTRAMTPLTDTVALWRLYRLLGQLAPDIVHAGTPKGGFLGIVAAAARGIPVRIYHVHGIRAMTERGWRRRVLLATERLTCRLSTRVLCVSASARQTMLDEKLCPPQKLVVLGAGSCNGVDGRGQFDPARFDGGTRAGLRADLNIPGSVPVIGFVGRLVRDKGIAELASAWHRLATEFPTLHLLLVGCLEEEDAGAAPVVAALRAHPRVRFIPWVEDPAPLYAVMDVVTLPSYREGLPTVLLEAAAMGLPAVASRVTGCVDAIVDGVTGTLVPPREGTPLAEAIAAYLRAPALRERHGAAGREHVLRAFVPEDVWRRVLALYRSLLSAEGGAAVVEGGSSTL